jgi:EF hand
MKLAILSLVTALGLGGTALADYGPPGMQGAPVVDDRGTPVGRVVDDRGTPVGSAGRRGSIEADFRPGPGPHRGELRQAVLDRFDRNHDGRLEPNERRHAVKALRKLARKLAREERNQRIGQRRADRLIQKYDANGNGNVDPGELPPRVERRLRRLDRNGDGWVDGRELAPRQ